MQERRAETLPPALLWGRRGGSLFGKDLVVPQRVTRSLAWDLAIPLRGVYPTEQQTHVHTKKNVCVNAHSSIIQQEHQQPKSGDACPSTDDG